MIAPAALCIAGLALTIVIPIGALILRAGVNTHNSFALRHGGAAPPPYLDVPRPTTQGTPPVASPNPYQARASSPSAARGAYATQGGPQLIPEPGFGKAAGIVIVRSIVTNIVGFVIGVRVMLMPQAGQALVPDQDPLATIHTLLTTQLPLMVINFLISFFLGALILKAMLPTSFGKACLIHLIEYLVYLSIIGVFIGIAFVFMAGNLGA